MATKKKAATKVKKWSAKVTETSDAMTLQKSVFTKSPHAIALSLKRSAEKSDRYTKPILPKGGAEGKLR